MGTFFETALFKVNFFYPRTRVAIILFSLLITAQLLPEVVINVFAIIAVVTIGLMHGATDHILYIHSDEAEFKTKIPKSFIIKYLSILAAMGVVWLLAPKIALIFFLIISAYHFGQTQLQYLGISEADWRKKLYYASWGSLVLSFIVLLNLEESKSLINSAIPNLNLTIFDTDFVRLAIIILGAFTVVSAVLLFRAQKWYFVIFEFIEIGVIALLAYQCSLLVSFGLFFGLWHSLRASQVQIDKVSEVSSFSVTQFIKESLPFTLISIFGISLMLAAAYYFGSEIRVEMLFLVAISMLTLPHMFIYEQFYNYFDLSTKEQK